MMNEIKELNEIHEEELSALRHQLVQLKNSFKTLQADLADREQTTFSNEEFTQLKKRNEQLERVIEHLRERTEEAKLETKTLRNELEAIYQKQETAPEPVQSPSNHALLQDDYDQAIADNKQLSSLLEEALNGRIAAEQRLEQMQRQQQENERALLEESESRLRIAQQHLAKKVKETTVLTERYEEIHRQYEEMKTTLEVTKGRTMEMQGMIESLKEALRSADSQSAKWEEKYFRLYDKFQEGEIRYRELKKVEERFMQMQAIFANMGSPISVQAISSPYDSFGMIQEAGIRNEE